MSRWSRPYRPRFPHSFMFGAVFTAVMWGIMLFAPLRHPWVPFELRVAFALALQIVVWRIATVGVYVGRPGIRLRTLFHTTVIPWSDIDRVLVEEDPRYQNRVIVLRTRDGRRIPAPLWQFPGYLQVRRRIPANQAMLRADELTALAEKLDTMARYGGMAVY